MAIQNGKEGRPDKTNPFQAMDVRGELDKLEQSLEALRLQFEQFFTGVLNLAPDKQHNDVKRQIRKLLRAPFRNSEMNYRLKGLEGRYNTLNSYWQRVMRERDAGTYVKDVFKANLRERMRLEEQQAGTAAGAAEKSLKTLFNSYREALEKNTGRGQSLDYDAFKKSIVSRSKELKEKNQGKKIAFKVVVNEGKVTIQATAKDRTPKPE